MAPTAYPTINDAKIASSGRSTNKTLSDAKNPDGTDAKSCNIDQAPQRGQPPPGIVISSGQATPDVFERCKRVSPRRRATGPRVVDRPDSVALLSGDRLPKFELLKIFVGESADHLSNFGVVIFVEVRQRGARRRMQCAETLAGQEDHAPLVREAEQHFQGLLLGEHPARKLGAVKFGRDRLEIEQRVVVRAVRALLCGNAQLAIQRGLAAANNPLHSFVVAARLIHQIEQGEQNELNLL